MKLGVQLNSFDWTGGSGRFGRNLADIGKTAEEAGFDRIFFGALLHLGWSIPLGFTVVAEPRILPATVVEALCGLVLTVAAFAGLTRMGRVWTAAFTAHAFALGGVLLGIGALAAGAGPSTKLNAIYHRVMLVALVAVLALLLSPTGRTALRRPA